MHDPVTESFPDKTSSILCSPAHVMPLLEIVRTQKTSPQSVLDLLTLSKAIKKTPVVVGNCTGFAVNRVFFPYTMAAAMMVDLGVDLYRIDRVIKAWGMPMGPFRSASLAVDLRASPTAMLPCI